MIDLFQKLGSDTRGTFLTVILIFGGVVTLLVVGGISGYATLEHRIGATLGDRDLAFHIAEAGAEYYRWHLAHDTDDYTDGTGLAGPYVHEYKDKTGVVVGSFSLEIDPPSDGSSLVTIRSTGWTAANPDASRIIRMRVGFPLLTDYAILSHASTTIGTNDETHGTVHSNDTIRFDGTADSWVRSAKDIQGGGGPKSFWQENVAPIEFSAMSGDLADIRDAADDDGDLLELSGKEGWHIQFTGAAYKLYKVNTRACYRGVGKWERGGRFWNGETHCYDIGSESLVGTYELPENGAIFSEDDLWVDGTVDGRVSIGVGKFPVQPPHKNIMVKGTLAYAAKAGDDVLGIVSQGSIIVPRNVPGTMEMDGAFLSQFGKIYRPYYDADIKTTLSIFGADISFGGSTFRYFNGYGHTVSGFEKTVHTYDDNLRYNPPRGFPVNPTYEVVSWEEL